ncbi:MAG: hypothetical protein LBG27_07015 [Spirochaetaceae bacterium]|jgi:hypothetical protein|nr:hypothetical protein [Spirochaetaceae bacterium]
MKKFFLYGMTVLLSVSLFLAGCDTEVEEKIVYRDRDVATVVPADAVPAGTETVLRGLLEASSGVAVIEYTGSAPAAELVIPAGKTVYLNKSGGITLSAHLAVEAGATVVLVKDLTTATGGKLLVNGTLKVASGGGLITTAAATEVTDYTVSEGVITPGVNTVIGTGKVQVLEQGGLLLKSGDVVETAATNKFTPAQAWAAAGKGHLAIDGSSTLSVAALLTGVAPTAKRGFSAESSATALPGTIPVGAYITVSGAITDAGADHKLTVNGGLEVTGNNFTGAQLTEITVGNYGSLVIPSTAFATTALTKITVGKGAVFDAESASNATYAAVTEITVGAGSEVTVDAGALFSVLTTLEVGAGATFDADKATAPTYAKLATLTVGDYAAAALAKSEATAVTFDATAGLGTLELGKNAAVDVGAATGAILGKTGAPTFTVSEDAVIGGKVTVGADAELIVDDAALTVGQLTVSGKLSIEGAGNVLLTADATKIIVNPTGSIDVRDADGTFGEATAAETKISITGSNSGKATVVESPAAVWTVTDDSTGRDISSTGKIVLGKLTLDFDGTSPVTGDPCAASATAAAAGKLVAGAGTTITFAGTD